MTADVDLDSGSGSGSGSDPDPGLGLGDGVSLPAPAAGKGDDGDVNRLGAAAPDQFFDGHPFGRAVFALVREMLSATVRFEVRVGKSQVGLRRERGFAYLWMPGQYLRNPTAEVVLSIALERRDESPRFKEVVRVSPTLWMHHLELQDVGDLDDEVRAWLLEASELAG